MIWTVTGYSYLAYSTTNTDRGGLTTKDTIQLKMIYATSAGLFYASGLVTKFALLLLFEKVMGATVDEKDLSALLQTAGLRNWARMHCVV